MCGNVSVLVTCHMFTGLVFRPVAGWGSICQVAMVFLGWSPAWATSEMFGNVSLFIDIQCIYIEYLYAVIIIMYQSYYVSMYRMRQCVCWRCYRRCGIFGRCWGRRAASPAVAEAASLAEL